MTLLTLNASPRSRFCSSARSWRGSPSISGWPLILIDLEKAAAQAGHVALGSLVHRPETMGRLGFRFMKHIDVNDWRKAPRAIKLIDSWRAH